MKYGTFVLQNLTSNAVMHQILVCQTLWRYFLAIAERLGLMQPPLFAILPHHTPHHEKTACLYWRVSIRQKTPCREDIIPSGLSVASALSCPWGWHIKCQRILSTMLDQPGCGVMSMTYCRTASRSWRSGYVHADSFITFASWICNTLCQIRATHLLQIWQMSTVA